VTVIIRQVASSSGADQSRAILREMEVRGVSNVLVHLNLVDTDTFLRAVRDHYLVFIAHRDAPSYAVYQHLPTVFRSVDSQLCDYITIKGWSI